MHVHEELHKIKLIDNSNSVSKFIRKMFYKLRFLYLSEIEKLS